MTAGHAQRLQARGPQTLVLVIAQSARYLAQQAAREGFRVRAIDQFNDADLQQSCERTYPLADFDKARPATILQAIEYLAGDQPAVLIAGTGAERFYPLFNQLPPQFTLANNTSECFAQCHTSARWLQLLDKLQIACPESRFERPISPAGWLFKPDAGWGGRAIQTLSDQATINRSGYFQRQIHGQPFSVLFFADRNGWQWLGTQRQHSLPDRFVHQRLDSHYPLSEDLRKQLVEILNRLNQALGLRGFNSADFIVTEQGELFILELNPRPAASMQFLDSPSLITAQLRSCIDGKAAQIQPAEEKQTLCYLFATHSGRIRPEAEWPASCHDLPAAGTVIRAGDIVCSALLPATATFKDKYRSIYRQVMHNIAA